MLVFKEIWINHEALGVIPQIRSPRRNELPPKPVSCQIVATDWVSDGLPPLTKQIVP